MGKSHFAKGLTDGLPICLGYLPVSFAFGIFAVNSGLPIWQTVLISLTTVTSAGQFAAVPIITAGGTLVELALSQLIINLRYALMSVSLSQRLDETVTPLHRAIIAFVNTDEVFAVASEQKGTVGRNYLYGLILTPFLGWGAGTLLGAVAGDVLPSLITSALGIAIYGMFIAIVVPPAKEKRSVAVCVLLSAVLSCLFYYLPALSSIPSGFVILLCTVIASAVMAVIAPVRIIHVDDKQEEKGNE